MNPILNVCFFAALTLFVAAPAARADCRDDDDSCWRKEWKELCERDVGRDGKRWCDRLVNTDKSWKLPKWEVIESLKVMGPDIVEAGKKYGVDPRAIAGAVLAENSLNVTKVDDFEEFLVKYKLASDGRIPILGRPFTFGWGQLSVEAAMPAEPLVAKAQGRKELRSREEVAQALLVPKEAMQYIAAVERRIQDIYLENGFDISKDPEILATLYNLGRTEELVQVTKRSGRTPKANFFGFFVKKYMHRINYALSLAEGDKAPVAAPASQVPPVAEGPAEPASPVEARVPNSETVVEVVSSLQLYQAPPACSDDSSSKVSEYQKIATYQRGVPVRKIAAHTAYQVLAPGLGCRLDGDKEPWSLIRGEDGAVGWVGDAALQKGSAKRVRQAKACDDTAASQCLSRLKQSYPELSMESASPRELPMRLSVIGKSTAPDWQSPRLYCETSQTGATYSSNASFPGFNYRNLVSIPNRGSVYPSTPLSELEAQEARDQLLAFKKRMMSELDLKDDSELMANSNPYAPILRSQFDSYLTELQGCLAKDSGPSDKLCLVMEKGPFKALESVPVPKQPTLAEWQKVREALMVPLASGPKASYAKVMVTDPSEKAKIEKASEEAIKIRKAAYRELLKPCKPARAWKLSKERLERAFAVIDSMTEAHQIYQYGEGALKDVASTCEMLASLDKPNDEPNCPQCAATSGSTWYNGVSVDRSALKVILRGAGDRDQYLADLLKDKLHDGLLQAPSQYSASGRDQCAGYDPFATARQIEKLLADKCVSVVYVPDPWLIKKLAGRTKQVLLRPFLTNDRYVVEVSGSGCGNPEGERR